MSGPPPRGGRVRDRLARVRTGRPSGANRHPRRAVDTTAAIATGLVGACWLDAVGAPAPTDPAELVRVGERVWTLTRLFNAREGLDRGDDRLPSAFARPLDGGPADGRALDPARFSRLLNRYYAARGWSESGLPSRPLLERVGLADVVDDDTPVAAEPLRPAGPEKP